MIELKIAYALPDRRNLDKTAVFDWRAYSRGRYLRKNIKRVWRHPIIWRSIIGLSIFWAVSQVLIAVFPAYAKEHLNIISAVTIQGLLACTGIGIVIGSLIAGRISRDYIETGLVSIAAIGIAIAISLLPVFDSTLALGVNFIVIGVMAGCLIVPLNSLIQYHADEHERGKVMASSNLVQNVMMISFLFITVAFTYLSLNTLNLIQIVALVTIGGAAYTLYALPQSLARVILSMVLRRRYRITVEEFSHLPENGAVLLLGNHVSWIDWAILQVACPRPIHFVMERGIYQRWYLNWFFRLFNVIPIAKGASKSALKTINAQLRNGEVVCLFPEGSISRNGQLGEFQKGFERAVDGVESGVIIPFYLHGLWGSLFSRCNDPSSRKASEWIKKRNLIVAFGPPLALTTNAVILKQRVFDLSIKAWQSYTKNLDSIPLEWLRTAKSLPGKSSIADSKGRSSSNFKTIVGTILLSRLVKQHVSEQNVGILLPTSTVGMITNMSVLLRGKTVVNLNYSSSSNAIACAIGKAHINTVITSRNFVEKLQQKGLDVQGFMKSVKIIYLEDYESAHSTLAKISTAFIAKLLPASILFRIYGNPTSAQSTAAILFSSGSEGSPKGIMLSHHNILANAKQVAEVLNTQSNDTILSALPLFHAFGLTVNCFMPLIEGIPTVCHPDPTDALKLAKAIAHFDVTIFCTTSTFLRLINKNHRIHPLMLKSLRLVVAGAERLTSDVRDTFKLKFSRDIYEGYGATEIAPVASVNVPNHIDTACWKIQTGNKHGTVGMPIPGTSFKVVDPHSLVEVTTGEDGLILVGGAQVMKGYLEESDKTTQAIVEIDGLRWYKTGDKGHVDDDGFLTIIDRYSRFAKLGGEMISLGAVEERAREVLDDAETDLVAVSLPDIKKGEKIVLMTDSGTDTNSIKKRMMSNKSHQLMIPAEIYCVDKVPKLGSGKTDFSTARAMALELSSES